MITLLSSLFSGILATCITLVATNILRRREEKKNFKMKIFKDVIAYRTDITNTLISTGNLQKALNQVFIAYNDCPEVLESFEVCRKSVMYRGESDKENEKIIDNLVVLLKAMAKATDVDFSFSNDDLFTKPILIGVPVIPSAFPIRPNK